MKYRLLAPGPTPVPSSVLTAMANPIWHHRTPAFEETYQECVNGLRWLFQTEHDVFTLSSSGTGAMEAAFHNLFSNGDTIITVGGGKFGERWGDMGDRLGLNAVRVPCEWGDAVEVSAVKAALDDNPGTKGVVVCASETSTGVRHPYEEIGKLIKDNDDCLFLVDGITAVGVWDLKPERDHIDILAGGSQKALMIPPGLGFLSVSEKAWKHADKAAPTSYYFDLKKERKALAKGQTAYTPAVTLITGLCEALSMMREEGLENIFARHARLAKAVRAGVQAMNLELFAKSPADSVTSVVNPAKLNDNAVYAGLRDRANLTIAGGQDHLKGKIFRVAHIGYYDELDIVTVLGAIEVVLRQEGFDEFSAGAGVGAAMPILEPGFRAEFRRRKP